MFRSHQYSYSACYSAACSTSVCIRATPYPVRTIAQTTPTGSAVQCPPEQERSEVIESIRGDIRGTIRETVLP